MRLHYKGQLVNAVGEIFAVYFKNHKNTLNTLSEK
jgi:hypothetical protein